MSMPRCAHGALLIVIAMIALAVPTQSMAVQPPPLVAPHTGGGACFPSPVDSTFTCIGSAADFPRYRGWARMSDEIPNPSCQPDAPIGSCAAGVSRVVAWYRNGRRWTRSSIRLDGGWVYVWYPGKTWTWVWRQSTGWFVIQSKWISVSLTCSRKANGRFDQRYCRA